MNEYCHCGGNNSLRSAIGAVRCECGGKLNEPQIFQRIISRLVEIEEDQFSMIGALQRLGADKCDQCGYWDKDCWCLLDHCSCLSCLSANPEWPLDDEGLNDQEYQEMTKSIVCYLGGRGVKLKFKGELLKAHLELTK